jgi:glycosyltransferase involved in cell wall biosynthesis
MTNSFLCKTLVVVPALNEERSIGLVVNAIRAAGWDCLVIDDGSNDRTREIALQNGATVVRHSINLGVGAALQTSFKWAIKHGYQRVIQCDADGQHLPSEIIHLVVAQLETAADLVIGSRFYNETNPVASVNLHKRIVMRTLSMLIRRKTSIHITDTTSGFRCIAEPLLSQFAKSFSTQYLGDTFEANLSAASKGYMIVEIPTRMKAREHGNSSASFLQAFRQVLRSVALALLNLSFVIEMKKPDLSITKSETPCEN